MFVSWLSLIVILVDDISFVSSPNSITNQSISHQDRQKFEMKSNSRRLNAKMIHYRRWSICIVLLQFFLSQVGAFEDVPHKSAYYDPETQDGIPVLSARGTGQDANWQFYDNDRSNISPSSRVQRRNEDSDENLEDDDDDDRDEYKSGSSNHDRYENPSFGESRGAAKDGDDIESFFDKHLGPPHPSDSESSNDEVPINELPARVDPDDHYEAAASGPLASLFSSLLSGHKRPFIITTTSDDSPSDNQQQKQQPSSTTTSSPSAANPVASSTRGAPSADLAPIGYITAPLAATSGISTYGPGGETNPEGGHTQEDYGPVREIYITRRRPTYSQASAVAYNPSGLSSNAYWRGASMQPMAEQQVDYARYPVAASYAHQQGQQAANPEEDEATVSYNLSFGRPSESADESDTSSVNPEEEGSVNGMPGYSPYQGGNMMRYTSASRAYNNYNYPVRMIYRQGGNEQQQQQQAAFNGARYHRDPSESIDNGYEGAQYSGSSKTRPSGRESKAIATRQMLLATLDQQIKENPYYRQQQSSASVPNLQALQSGQRITTRLMSKSPRVTGDVDSYKSFHSESDPYRSYTTSSHLISEPVSQPNEEGYKVSKIELGNSTSQRSSGRDNKNLLTGPLTKDNIQKAPIFGDLLRTGKQETSRQTVGKQRAKREDSYERDNDDGDDDGVWVDDDEDDDNKQQSSDVNETAQEPEEEGEEEEQQEPSTSMRALPGIIGGPIHGYDISPDDLMVYNG